MGTTPTATNDAQRHDGHKHPPQGKKTLPAPSGSPPDPLKPPTSLAQLLPEQAATLLQADLANLAKKVKAGKPLSKSERAILQSAMHGTGTTKEFVENLVELAAAIGVTRRTLQTWRKNDDAPEPRPDGRWHVPTWLEYKRKLGGVSSDRDDAVDGRKEKARQILLQNERLAMRILAEKKELIPKIMAQQIFSKLVVSAKSRCFGSVNRFVTLARMAENTTVAAEEIRKELTVIFRQLESGDWIK